MCGSEDAIAVSMSILPYLHDDAAYARAEIGGKGEQGSRYRLGDAITQLGATASAWSNGRTKRPPPKTSEPEQ